MKRKLLFFALVLTAFVAAGLTCGGVAKADEFNVGSVRLNNGTPCSSGQCQLSTTGGQNPHTVVTGVSRAYLGWFFVFPSMARQYISFNGNAYIGSSGFGYRITVQGRIFCSGYWHYTQAKSFYEQGTSSAVYFGTLTMLSPC